MTPTNCMVKHDPPHSYGDCLRACVATIMDADPETVPHFADDGVTGEQSLQAMRDWLNPQGFTLTGFAYPDVPVDELLEFIGTINPDTTWMLFGSIEADGRGGDHVVVCRGGKVVHDPAWIPTSIKSVGALGYWQIVVVSRL